MGDPRAPVTAGTQGFLFCDLRGYSAFVDANGDLAAADLLATYRGLVRAVIAEHAGAEIRTEGDSVYIVFPTASGAVEAGLAIVGAAAGASTRERPLRVGVGVHAGETVASAEGPIGGAVNIAARVCAKAEPGEVLVTDTVRSLTRTLLPYRFVGLGPQRLKGVGSVALFRVEATSAGRVAHLRRRLAARRRLVAGVALLGVFAIVGGSAAWIVARPAGCLTLGPETMDVVARIDPARGCVVATYPVGRKPTLIVSAGGSLWVANKDDGTVSALSSEGKPIATIAGGREIAAMSADDTYLWVLDSKTGWFTPIALATATVHAGPYLAPGRGRFASASQVAEMERTLSARAFGTWFEWRSGDFRGLVVDGRYEWMSNSATGQIVPATLDGLEAPIQIDAAPDPVDAFCYTGSWWLDLTKEGCVPTAAAADPRPMTSLLAVVGHEIWAGHEASTELSALSLGTSTPRHCSPSGASGQATGLASIAGELWVSYSGGQVARVRDCSPDIEDRSVASTLSGVGGDAHAIWVASDAEHVAIRLDPATLDVTGRIDVGGLASGVAVGPDGSVWVTVAGRT